MISQIWLSLIIVKIISWRFYLLIFNNNNLVFKILLNVIDIIFSNFLWIWIGFNIKNCCKRLLIFVSY